MLNLNNCPRCSEVLRFDSDMYGKFYRCFLCGYYKDVTPVIVIPPELKGRLKAGRHGPNYKVEKRKKYDLFKL